MNDFRDKCPVKCCLPKKVEGYASFCEQELCTAYNAYHQGRLDRYSEITSILESHKECGMISKEEVHCNNIIDNILEIIKETNK